MILLKRMLYHLPVQNDAMSAMWPPYCSQPASGHFGRRILQAVIPSTLSYVGPGNNSRATASGQELLVIIWRTLLTVLISTYVTLIGVFSTKCSSFTCGQVLRACLVSTGIARKPALARRDEAAAAQTAMARQLGPHLDLITEAHKDVQGLTNERWVELQAM